ncbi:hypothetical protein LCGC14_1204310 [marine sediment metagenome]|uniref:Uncharacterized protein n=1 Tax=marine sediment metagenome TaxID=412755 RepID=A0A0F9M3E2_9ZZZZ
MEITITKAIIGVVLLALLLWWILREPKPYFP